ncbi:M48 family metallopeptidase [Endozoicomonas elysicola]|uniref:Peptidase M48 domain-containing protein n=1 Tax=Endozoicomonas elysicola TaxID=305900 RepID=A0A081K7Q9_9GAMM|nr:M48 family metallopeptidase [Endozoicomonas elysicola]KEI70185.1 hypothetical protein GV64_04990 [Endozoicomonas elysicola]
MNFFQHQEKARTQTRYLLALMALAVLSLILAINCIYAGYAALQKQEPFLNHFTWETFIISSAVVISTVLLASVTKTVMLAHGGGKAVAESLGAMRVKPSTNNRYERRLLNVVEEIAIASGTPVPPVYLLHGERGINAFAAGVRLNNAVIGITKGAMEQLSRDELEGVIAHEFSHIINGDIRLNMRLIGIVFGITMLTDVGYHLYRHGYYSRSKQAGYFYIVGIGMMLVGYIGAFFGNIIRASVNRTREYLADASAVQYTRDNEGLASALKKIGGAVYGSNLDSGAAMECSHMMFGSAFTGSFWNLFATHPPLDNRIRKLTPNWNGQYITPKAIEIEKKPVNTESSKSVPGPDMAVAGVASALSASVSAIGAPKASHIKYARSIVGGMPPMLSEAIHHSNSAYRVIMALLLDDAPAVLKKQCDLITRIFPQEVLTKTLELHGQLENARLLNDRLSILEMTLPTLKMLNVDQQERLKKVLLMLATADGKTTVMEWSLITIVDHTLPKKKKTDNVFRSEKYRSVKQLSGEVSLLVKALVGMSGMSVEDKRSCYTKTIKGLGITITKEKVSFKALSQGLKKIALLRAEAKEQLLKALCQCIEHDGEVAMEEAQALRAIAVVMECPVPPLVAQAA